MSPVSSATTPNYSQTATATPHIADKAKDGDSDDRGTKAAPPSSSSNKLNVLA